MQYLYPSRRVTLHANIVFMPDYNITHITSHVAEPNFGFQLCFFVQKNISEVSRQKLNFFGDVEDVNRKFPGCWGGDL